MEKQLRLLQKDYTKRVKELQKNAKLHAKALRYEDATKQYFYANIYEIAARDIKSILDGKNLY